MRAPPFWSAEIASPLATLLAPASWLYGFAAKWRFQQITAAKAGLPVICIGNFVAGGAGKTPCALALAELLRAQGEQPVFLTRGYGGKLSGPVPVQADSLAGDVGDEALLLAARAPTILSRDRVAGAALAAQGEASLILMDDGLQNPHLAKDFSLVVIDAAYGLGNGRVLPAGPLRMGFDFQLGLADALLVVGQGRHGEQAIAAARAKGVPVLHAKLVPTDADWVAGQRLVAFTGIARPEKFIETLFDLGADLAGAQVFPDHYLFKEKDAERLLAAAKARQAQLVTTEKDHVRLRAGGGRLAELAEAARMVKVEMRFEQADQLRAMVMARIAGADRALASNSL